MRAFGSGASTIEGSLAYSSGRAVGACTTGDVFDPRAQQCGWLKDKYGLSWQIVPTVLQEMLKDHESPKAQRAMNAMLRMKKLNIAELERAFAA
jgi:predicted 3-demethylubiquinone-9 3-methyltransferase (glyoxalase superfamily)